MANLLPTKERIGIEREQRSRLYDAVLVLVAGAFAFGTLLLIPSAVSLIAAKESGEDRLEATKRLAALQEHAGAGANLSDTKEKMALLSESQEAASPRVLIEEVVTLLPGGVTLGSIVFVREGAASTLDISGEAADRASLIAFGDALRSSGLFGSVVIPIESLAQAVDLQFRLELSLEGDTDQP